MPEEQFDQNFVWYEWSFVSPDQVPEDDLGGAFDAGARAEPAVFGYSACVGSPESRDDEPRWMT